MKKRKKEYNSRVKKFELYEKSESRSSLNDNQQTLDAKFNSENDTNNSKHEPEKSQRVKIS